MDPFPQYMLTRIAIIISLAWRLAVKSRVSFYPHTCSWQFTGVEDLTYNLAPWISDTDNIARRTLGELHRRP